MSVSFFCPPPSGDVWPLSADCCLEHNIICWETFIQSTFQRHDSEPSLRRPRWVSNPWNLGSVGVTVSPRSYTEPPLVSLSAPFVGWIGSGAAERISLTAPFWAGVNVLILNQPTRTSHPTSLRNARLVVCRCRRMHAYATTMSSRLPSAPRDAHLGTCERIHADK